MLEIFVRPLNEAETPSVLRLWAGHIEVRRVGDELFIVGTHPGKAAPADLLALFRNYLFAAKKELEAKGPHLELANANSDEELIQFIQKWGPIATASWGIRDWSRASQWRHWPSLRKGNAGPEITSESKRAVESLLHARAIQRVIGVTVDLLKITQQEIFKRGDAVQAMADLAEALSQTNRVFRHTLEVGETTPTELGSQQLLIDCEVIYREAKRKRTRLDELRECCWDAVCALLNRFPDNLISTKKGVLPVPSAGHGVLPLVMFMLRLDLIAGRKIIVCEGCGDYFLQRRLGERACDTCKERVRARRYYQRHSMEVLRRRKRKRRQRAREKKRRSS